MKAAIARRAFQSVFGITLSRLFVVVATGYASQAQGEVLVVWEDDTPLYRNRRLVDSLDRGQMVRQSGDTPYAGWVRVSWRGKRYNVNRDHVKSRAQVREIYAERLQTIENRILRLKEAREFTVRRLHLLHEALLQIQLDRVIAYEYTVATYSHSDNDDISGNRRHVGKPVLKTRRVAKVSSSRSRRLEREWREEIDALWGDAQDAADAYVQACGKRAYRQVELAEYERRFARAAAGRSAERKMYLVNQDRAPLYKNRRIVKELDRGDAVRAREHERYAQWLVVTWGGETYNSPGKHYHSRLQLISTCKPELAAAECRRTVFRENLELVTAALELLDLMSVSLEVINARSGAYVPFSGGIAGRYNSFYPAPTRPEDGRQVIMRHRAYRLLREWEQFRATLTTRRHRLQEDLDDVRTTMRTLSVRLEESLEKLQ